MSNTHQFKIGPLDQIISEMSPEERRQLILDYDHLETHGSIDESLLRATAQRVYESLHNRRGFDATYMMMIGLSAHKLNSIDAMREKDDLGLSDQRALAEKLVQAIAAIPTIREAAISNAVEDGVEAATEEDLEAALETYLFDRRADMNETQANTLDEYISQARNILGIPETTPEEELAKLSQETSPQP